MEYMTALEREIVTEGLISNISEKVTTLFKIIGDLIRKAIKFLTGLISKLRKNKKNTNQDATPSNMNGSGAEVMTNTTITPVVVEELYDCGNELERVVDDVQFCIEMLIKRPKPDHKTGKGYGERWAGDNELIADRMAKAMEILEKLDGIEKKTIDVDKAEMLKGRLEALNAQYDKYSRIYDMFVKKNQHTTEYFIGTITSFHMISDVAGKALNIILKLQDPKG